MNTMYAIVASRTREIGTLRALGFSRRSILYSFVMESVFLATLAGVIGCLLALPMNGFSTGTAQTQSFGEVAFSFRLTPQILLTGMAVDHTRPGRGAQACGLQLNLNIARATPARDAGSPHLQAIENPSLPV